MDSIHCRSDGRSGVGGVHVLHGGQYDGGALHKGNHNLLHGTDNLLHGTDSHLLHVVGDTHPHRIRSLPSFLEAAHPDDRSVAAVLELIIVVASSLD